MARNKTLECYLGKVHKLSNNPRKMSDGAYTKLIESLERGNDIEFLAAKRLVVWEVPIDLSDSRKWPFDKQQGKLVVLGGNQRYTALQELGYDKIPDDWVAIGKHKDGSWWTPEEAERFILLDNNPEGISGETDYEILVRQFNEECLKAVGMDFAQTSLEFQEKMAEPMEEEVEQGEHGERDQELEDFINRRESSRGMVEEMLDMGFYTVTVFETHAQKMEYLRFLEEKYGVKANREVFVNGFDLAAAQGKQILYSGLKFPEAKPSKALQEMAMDGVDEGWEVREGNMIPEGTEAGEEGDDEGKLDDGSGIDGII